MLSSSRMRLQRGLLLLAATGAVSEELILDGGDGVRLQGWHSHIEGREPKGMALLLHGWEGSAESSYMRMAAARMLEQGFDVVRLNFRDHGNTHHLNPGIFHSNLIDEVVHAAGDIAQRWPQLPLVAGVTRWAATSCCAWPCARGRRAAAARGVGMPGIGPGLDHGEHRERSGDVRLVFPPQVGRFVAAQARSVPRTERLRRPRAEAGHPRADRVAGRAPHQLRLVAGLFRWLLDRRRSPGHAAGAGRHPDGAGRSGDPVLYLQRLAAAAPGAPGNRLLGRPLRLPGKLAGDGFSERWVAQRLRRVLQG